jgi:predicted NAD/FAD-dependent oxidoreductase
MRFGAKISKVERNNGKIIIHQGDNTEEFDNLIVAFPINQFKELTNFTVDENYIARSVKFNPVWRLVFLAQGMPQEEVLALYLDTNLTLTDESISTLTTLELLDIGVNSNITQDCVDHLESHGVEFIGEPVAFLF